MISCSHLNSMNWKLLILVRVKVKEMIVVHVVVAVFLGRMIFEVGVCVPSTSMMKVSQAYHADDPFSVDELVVSDHHFLLLSCVWYLFRPPMNSCCSPSCYCFHNCSSHWCSPPLAAALHRNVFEEALWPSSGVHQLELGFPRTRSFVFVPFLFGLFHTGSLGLIGLVMVMIMVIVFHLEQVLA